MDNAEAFQIIKDLENNPDISGEVLSALSEYDNWIILCFVAEHKNTPTFILEKLSKDINDNVRYRVAQNPTYIKYKNIA